MNQTRNNWIKIIYTISALILLLSGFVIGYIYSSKDYDKEPLIYGIKKINSMNKADFICSCISNNPRTITFLFDKEGIRETYLWDG